jgi:hypothetical protein
MALNTLQEKNNRLREFSKNHKNTVENCSDYLDPRYTRLNQNVLSLKSAFLNRFEFPLLDPKNSVFYGINNTLQIENSRHGLSSRVNEKEKYRSLIKFK